MNSSKLITFIVAIHLVTNLCVSFYLIAFQLEAKQARQVAKEQREEMKKQNDFIVCILKSQPSARDDVFIEKCRNDTTDSK